MIIRRWPEKLCISYYQEEDKGNETLKTAQKMSDIDLEDEIHKRRQSLISKDDLSRKTSKSIDN